MSGLGLTSYTVEDVWQSRKAQPVAAAWVHPKLQDMNDLVNHLATFVGLDFEDLPEETLGPRAEPSDIQLEAKPEYESPSLVISSAPVGLRSN